MYKTHKLLNAAASQLTISGAAVTLEAAITAAGGASSVIPTTVNAIDMAVESGSIRVLYDGNTPTITEGVLYNEGDVIQFRGIKPSELKIISTSGSISIGVQVGHSPNTGNGIPSEPSSVAKGTNVSVSGLGLATAVKQDTSNAILTTIDTDTGTIASGTISIDGKTPVLGNTNMVGSVPFTIASDDVLTLAANTLLGTIDTDTGNIASSVSSLDGKTPVLGNTNMAGSVPFTIASNDTLTLAANTLLGTIDGDTDSIKTAVELLDDTIFVDQTDFTLATSKLAAIGIYAEDPTAMTAVPTGKVGVAKGDLAGRTITNMGTQIDKDNDSISTQFIEGTEVGTGAQVASLEVATEAGILWGFWVTNNSGATAYYGVSDNATLPADTAVPSVPSVPVANGATTFIDLRAMGGFAYTDGCFIWASSTIAVKTITGATSQIYAWKE